MIYFLEQTFYNLKFEICQCCVTVARAQVRPLVMETIEKSSCDEP